MIISLLTVKANSGGNADFVDRLLIAKAMRKTVVAILVVVITACLEIMRKNWLLRRMIVVNQLKILKKRMPRRSVWMHKR